MSSLRAADLPWRGSAAAAGPLAASGTGGPSGRNGPKAPNRTPICHGATELLIGEAGLVAARIDTDELVRARYDFDVVGHYARANVFSLHVDERPKRR